MQRATAPHSSSLPQIVCAWQPSKLTELANTFAESCSPPQTSFAAYHNYKAYFEPLLLAEISADLCSAVDKYQRTSLRQPKIRARREDVGTTVARVLVQKVTRVHTFGFGWAVDLESHDRRGPVGCVDSDVVALWVDNPTQSASKNQKSTSLRNIPTSAILAVIVRSSHRTGCRIVTTSFPDGNENGVRIDLEEGEENEEAPPALRVWNLLRLGSLTTMKREFQALQTIKSSALLPKLLRPHLRTIDKDNFKSSADDSAKVAKPPSEAAALHRKEYHSEYFFTDVISAKTNLNQSQARAIIHASTCRDGFAVIQGPPGTGKTKTLIGLLNVIHMVQYQQYYESVLAALDPLYSSTTQKKDVSRSRPQSMETAPTIQKETEGSLLQSMMVAMTKTASSSAAAVWEPKGIPLTRRAKRPRVLICAPSNSAVDEILTRLTRSKLIDGKGNTYCPELARIGAGDKVSEAAKPLTAEGQAEAFLDEVCGDDTKREAREKSQLAFLSRWQTKCNALLLQLERTPKKKTPTSNAAVIDLHEKLERMERDLRRLEIAAVDNGKVFSREEKLRQIARTYVEDAQLVFATLSGSASSILTKNAAADLGDHGDALFDTVIIDEAAQATETSSLIPMSLGASRCIFVGDPQQLPATVLSSGAAGLAYGQSLLERVVRAGQGILLLDTQYRMHPAISSFPRRYFYNGNLVDDESVQGENRARPYHRDVVKPRLGPYVFLDISEGEERRSRNDRSIFNPSEAELAAMIYIKLKKEYSQEPLFSSAAKVPGSTVGFGVVTPYKRQMQELRQSFDRAGVPTSDVEIDTVDSFQGREKDFVVFSCVRTAAVNRGIGFVRDVRRMNVGLTRARASLIILGSAQALAEGSPDWAELIEDANSRGCLISVTSLARCLQPEIPSNMAVEMSETNPQMKAQLSLHGTSSAVVRGTTLDDNLGIFERRATNPTHRIDPRTRANRRNLTVDANGEGKGVLSEKLTMRESEPSMGNLANRDSNISIVDRSDEHQNLTKLTADSDNVSPSLQSTLEQMTKLLRDAGVQNTKAVEDTLREHIKSGGALDIETVMAAAIATGRSNSHADDDTGKGPIDNLGAEAGNVLEPERITSKPHPIRVSQQSESENPVKEETSSSAILHNPVYDEDKQNQQAVTRHREQSNPHREPKSKSRRAGPKPKRGKDDAEGSGWDMAIAGSRHADGETEIKGKKEGAPEYKLHELASLPHKPRSNEKSASETAPSEGRTTTASGGDDDLASRNAENQVHDADSPHQASRKRWSDEKDGDERKRNRMTEHRGRGVKRGRGGDGGNQYSKRPRHSHRDQTSSSFGDMEPYNFENQWNQQAPFNPNMPGFSAMPAMMDPSLPANSHSMFPLQALQQQAMQQEAMRQQAMRQELLQQQALQQQSLQNQAYQQQAYQQQAYQQQALQQEAFRQGALMMQMSAAGMPPSNMLPTPYAMADFNSFNAHGPAEATQPSSEYENSHYGRGRRGRSGRGRGRQKGGRGRRY